MAGQPDLCYHGDMCITKSSKTRITGFAQKKNGMYQIVIENGSPRLAAIETMVSELRNR